MDVGPERTVFKYRRFYYIFTSLLVKIHSTRKFYSPTKPVHSSQDSSTNLTNTSHHGQAIGKCRLLTQVHPHPQFGFPSHTYVITQTGKQAPDTVMVTILTICISLNSIQSDTFCRFRNISGMGSRIRFDSFCRVLKVRFSDQPPQHHLRIC